jgi:hypothetical protein
LQSVTAPPAPSATPDQAALAADMKSQLADVNGLKIVNGVCEGASAAPDTCGVPARYSSGRGISRSAALAELGRHRQRLCRILNRPNSMVPEIRILGPLELARCGGS